MISALTSADHSHLRRILAAAREQGFRRPADMVVALRAYLFQQVHASTSEPEDRAQAQRLWNALALDRAGVRALAEEVCAEVGP